MSNQRNKELDELLQIAEKISVAPIDDNMKDAIMQFMLKKYLPAQKPKTEETQGEDGEVGGAAPPRHEFNNTIQQLLRRENVSPSDIEKIFYIDEEGVDFSISDLKVKSNKEGLRVAACFVGARNAISSGKYLVPLKELRKAAELFGVYDVNNFSQYMKMSKTLFKSYKAGEDTVLSPLGIKEAAKHIKRLSSEK